MYLILAYDIADNKELTKIRKEFEALGGERLQFSIYFFYGEQHQIDKVFRHMHRFIQALVTDGDVRVFILSDDAWNAQQVLKTRAYHLVKIQPEIILIWGSGNCLE